MYLSTNFIVHTCVQQGCGAVWAITSDFDRLRRNDHTTFYCPYGHGQSYKTESDEERLKRQLAQATHNAEFYQRQRDTERNDHQHTKNRLNATKGVVTRVKRRVGNGVCPCCTRSFGNLAAHMKHQHPHYHLEAAE